MAKADTPAEKAFTQYAVVIFADLNQVVAEVNNLLSRGWSLVGGIQVSAQGSNVYHLQSVAK